MLVMGDTPGAAYGYGIGIICACCGCGVLAMAGFERAAVVKQMDPKLKATLMANGLCFIALIVPVPLQIHSKANIPVIMQSWRI